MPDPKTVTIDEFVQEIKDKYFHENLTLKPEHVPKFFVDNIVKRTLAHLYAHTAQGTRKLQCTDAGYLKVSVFGSAIDNDECFTYTSQTAEDTQTFAQTVQRVVVNLTVGNVKIKFQNEAGTWSDWYYIARYGNGVFERSVKAFTIDDFGYAFTGVVHGEW